METKLNKIVGQYVSTASYYIKFKTVPNLTKVIKSIIDKSPKFGN